MTSKVPLISVIVPIYNVDKYIKRSIDSILTQTYKNTEIILVDDGSTDKSGSIIDAYAKKHNNIVVIRKKNGGVSSARNAGVSAATGEWIAFVDPDDYITKDYIEKLYDTAVANDADITTCTFVPFTDDGSSLKKTPSWPTVTLSGREAINDMMKNKRPAYLWLNLFRAELFRKNNISFPVGRKYEDIAAKVMLLYYAKKVAFINEPLYYYLIRHDGITGEKVSDEKYSDYLEAISSVKKFLSKAPDSDSFVYMKYFELCSLFTLLNYFAKEKKLSKEMIKKRREITRRIRKLYPTTKFPSAKSRLKLSLAVVAMTSRRAYSALYRGVK